MANRKSWGAPFCLATRDRPHYSPFSVQTIEGGMSGLVPEHDDTSFDLQCFPLYSLVLALGNPTINYFSLDIEGAEFKVIKFKNIMKIMHNAIVHYTTYICNT